MATKKIRSKVAKEALIDASTITDAIKENTENTIKNILSETVNAEYKKIINEATDDDDDEKSETEEPEKDDFEEDEVKDTDDTDDDDEETDDGDDDDSDDLDLDDDSDDADVDGSESAPDDVDMDDSEDFGIGDDEYDLTDADDDDVIKVYKKLNDDDQVKVVKDGDKIKLKDNENGSEFLIDLGSDDDDSEVIDIDTEEEPDEEDILLDNDADKLHEIKRKSNNVYEILIKEDDNVGYTDNYQDKDAMDYSGEIDAPVNKGYNRNFGSDGVNSRGKEKPFSKLKAKQAPFDECDMTEEDDVMAEGVRTRSKWNQTHASKGVTEEEPEYNRKGTKKKSHAGKYKAQIGEMRRVANALEDKLTENAEMKNALRVIKGQVAEAALTNINLANIVRLITENSTTEEEKKKILKRFANEAVNRAASYQLYESIKSELNNKNSVNESKISGSISAEGSRKINETVLCESDDINKIHSLMNRMESLND